MKNFLLSLGLILAFAIVFKVETIAQEGTKITQTTLVESKVNSVLHISCHGDKKGAINIMVSGGVPPYTYKWSNGATTQDIAGLAAGKYTVRILDSYGCPDSLTVEVKQPNKLAVKIDSVQDILCYSFNNGKVDVSVTGGVKPYVYSWSDESTTQDLRNASAGEYALLVTDANHCQEIISADIRQNPLIVRSDEKVQNIACSGDSTGTIDINVRGGVPPYTYRWTSGQRTEDISSLIAGTYTVQVTDSRGCFETYSTKVNEPNPIVLNLDEVRHINCANDNSGSISVDVKGGIKPYSYKWNDSLAYTQDLAGLAAGQYTLVVQDKMKCKKTLVQEVNQPDELVVDIDQVKNVSSYSGSDGAIYISVKGGVVPYKYRWSNGSKSEDIANIPANNYTCRIIDDNKCVNKISVNIDQPALLDVEITHIEHIKCFGETNGYIDVDVKGGIAPYKYDWSNGDSTKNIKNLESGTYNLTVTDANGVSKSVKGTIDQPKLLSTNIQSISNNLCFGDKKGIIDINVKGGTSPFTYNWSNGNKSQDISKLSAGKYTVRVIDYNQCVDTLTAIVEESPLLELKSKEIVDINCYGTAAGIANIEVTGGVSPYSFKWSNGADTRDLFNLRAGQYNLKVTDSKGCYKTLDVRIEEPTLLISSVDNIVDVKCKGDSTGAINLNINGGTAPYSYQWSNGKTTKDNTLIKAGSYTVKISDAKGCLNTISATVMEPSELYSTLEKATNIDCFSDVTGVIDVNVGGGVPPYVYKWSNGATTQNLIGIKAGEYVLNVTDQNNCNSEMKTTIVENSKLVSSVEEITHVECNGLNTGAAKINVGGGVEPYTFLWNNGANTKDLSSVKAGKYTLSITDAKACMTSVELEINEPTEFTGEFSAITQISCHGDSNGVLITSFTGGVEPYTYLWNTKETTKDIKDLLAGTYTLTATDKNGCTENLEAVINQPTMLDLELVSTTDNLCNGERNGAIDIAVRGGVTPYKYEWTNNATTQDLSNLPAGKYKVHVTGATGCEKSLETTINEPTPLELSIKSTTNVNCYGENNGTIDLSVNGGVEPYVYSWSNGASTQDLSDIVAGSYTANVIDANGCYNSISAIIKQPEPLSATITDVKNILCNGDSTGAISIDIKGGVTPYVFKWSNGASTEDISGLKVGDYSVEITDASGCSQNLSATITEPPLLISEVVATQNVLCNGMKEGSVDISVSGGVTPYVYAWSDGSNNQDLSNVGAGNYNVKVSDANGCQRHLNIEISEPDMLVVSIAEINNIREFGNVNGSMSISVKGGLPPYKYSWSNGATSQDISELVAGDYSVIVNDANGCRQDLNATISQPDVIELTLDSIHHIRCYGETVGYAKMTARGGVPPYEYKWSNGIVGNELKNVTSGEYTLIVTDANNASKQADVSIIQPEFFELKISEISNPTCFELNNGMIKTDIKGGTTPYIFQWNNGASSQNLRGITSGKYVIKVTDSRGCIQIDSTELKKPEALQVNLLNTEHIKCYGEHKGSVSIGVDGGTPPYQYNWNHGSKEQNLSDLMAGNYTVKVIDANKCVKAVSTTVNEPSMLVAKLAEVKDVPCFGENKGSISTSVTGGMSPYKYNWSNGDSTASSNNLVKGSYTVDILDANGCQSTLSANITEPAKLTGNINNVNNINCFGANEGAIGIEVKGGVPPYTYGWTNGSNDQNLTAIPAGDYTVKVTDNQGCEISLSASVTEPTQLLATVNKVVDIKCFGENKGAIDIGVAGGSEPYSYSWSNGAMTQDLVKIGAGDYSLKVTDSRGCDSYVSSSVSEPELLVVSNTSISNIKCSGQEIGQVTVAVKGGVEPYVYSWNNGETTRDIQNIPAGIYELTVTDANGCAKVSSADITEPPALKYAIDAVKHISCNGESNGSIDLSVSGGTIPYSYQWSNGYTSQDLLDVPAGEYSVIVKEGNGCESTLTSTIDEPTLFVSELVAVEHNKCFDDEKGSITISAEGGTTPYSFKWSNGATTQNLKDIRSRDYSVLVSDANGCNRTIKTIVEQPERLTLVVDSARNVKCCGDTSGAIFITVTGGVAPYNYLWSHGKTTQDITGLVEGQYTVSVTDANNCVVNTPEEGATIYEKIISQGKFVSRDILFDVGKATIKEKSFIEISRIASFMKEHPQIKFSIEGHTDSQGDAVFNQKLSERRAKAIKQSLIKFGISKSRLTVKGLGEGKPIDSNTTEQGRAKNRRVEFIPM